MVTELNGKIYVAGGYGGLTAFDSYDPKANRWERHANLPASRNHSALVALDGKVYLIGGTPSDAAGRSDLVWSYDPTTNRWTERAKLLQEELAARLAENTGRNLYVLSILTAVLLPMTLVTGIFGMNVADLPGFPRALSRTLAELRMAGVQPSQLNGDDAGGDLAVLLTRAVDERRKSGAVDYATILATATAELQKKPASLAATTVVLLDVSIGTRAEAEFIRALVAAARHAIITCPRERLEVLPWRAYRAAQIERRARR